MPRAFELTATSAKLSTIEVSVGVVCDVAGNVLLSQRPAGKHMAGAWEFPGGKRRADETAIAALKRELEEELGIRVLGAEPLLDLEFDYPDRSVRLAVFWISEFVGVVEAREHQPLQWLSPATLEQIDILPADEPIITAIKRRLA